MSARKSATKNRRSIISLTTTPTVADVIDDGSGTPLGLGSAMATDPLPVNDDEAERLMRRRNRVMELRQQHDRRVSVGSTSGGGGVDSSHSHSTNLLSGLTSAQLAEHYEACIKLNAENKITVKNAFGLHLIDYMAEMLKKKDSEMNNFQVASCTLDASTKIYAYRVDCIHAETQKMACGLSRSSGGAKDKRMRSDDDGELGVDDDEGGDDRRERAKKKKKEAKRGKTIEKNVKALNANKFDLQLEVDPLFRKTTELFADGGAGGGILLSSLCCRNDGCELVLDSMDPMEKSHSSPEEQTKSQMEASFVEISSFVDIIRTIASKTTKICPSFADFEFGSWKLGDTLGTNWEFTEDVRNESNKDISSDRNDAYECNEDFHDGGGGGGEENVEDHTVANPNSIHETERDPTEVVPNMDLTQMLATEPSEYSYFIKDFETAWAGPNHWNIKPLSKGIAMAKDPKERKPRAKKTAVIQDYDVDSEEIERFFAKSKARLTFTKETIKLWNTEVTTLPEDIHYDTKTLYQLFTNPKAAIRQKPSCVQNTDADIQNYNYENANDVENFCPGIPDDRRETSYDGSDNHASPSASRGFPESNVGFDTQLESQDGTMSQMMAAFTGDNLVQQPWRVAKFDIPLARMAKRINVKRLKEGIWKILDKNIGNRDTTFQDDDAPLTDAMEQSFLDVYRRLPKVISSEMTQNVSIPIAFECILHLANEKNLHFSPQLDLKDFMIKFAA